MASKLEQQFYNLVAVANGGRQSAYATAWAAYGGPTASGGAYNPANLAAYQSALVNADVAYYSAVDAASTTIVGSGGFLSPVCVPEVPGSFGGPIATIAT